jgi:hypothetical protein
LIVEPRDFTIEARVVLLDPPRQRVFLRWDLAGASNVFPICRQIELMIVLVDRLEFVLSRFKVAPG